MIFDLHNDFLTAVGADDRDAELQNYIAACLRGCGFAVWTSELALDADTFGNYAAPKTPFYGAIAVEDLGSVKAGDYGAFLERYAPLYVSLTWNGDNPLAGGTGCERPLTARGRDAVGALNAHRVPLDLSHLSDAAFYDAVERAERVLITHTASRALCAHPRCVTDAMAKLVAARGGIVGVAAVPNFLDGTLRYGENCGRETYARHICHFAEVVGPEHVAIGTDFNGAEYFPRGLTAYADFAALQADLCGLGMSVQDIEKIFYKNAEKYFGIEETQ